MTGIGGWARGASGVYLGANRGPFFWSAWAAVVAISSFVTLISINDSVRAAEAAGQRLELWRVATAGFSSVAVLWIAFPPLRRLARSVRPGRVGLARLLATHALGLVAFTFLHVAGLILIRVVVHALYGEAYRADLLAGVASELPRDGGLYVLIVALVWAIQSFEQRAAPGPAAGPRVFEIRDGGRVIRIAVSEILAVSAADNYAEFHLRDGRRPLMRATLGALAEDLAGDGFVRTHRSWLVNAACVAEIAAAGSGDARLLLAGGLEAPLSRRYRGPLRAALRANAAA